MSLHIRTSDAKLLQSPHIRRKPNAEPLPIKLDLFLGEFTWAVYDGDSLKMGPYEIEAGDKEVFGVMRGMLKQAGYHEPEAPPLATSQPQVPPPKREVVKKQEAAQELSPAVSLPTFVPVKDEDSGTTINVDGAMYAQAMAAQAEVQYHWESGWRHLVSLGLALKKIVDGRLYVALGFSSLEHYARKHFDAGRHWVYDRIAIASKLIDAGVDPVSVDSGQQFPSISRLRAALPMGPEQFAAFIEGTAGGQTKPPAEMSVPEIKALVKGEDPPSQTSSADEAAERKRSAELEEERTEREREQRRAEEAERKAQEAERRASEAEAEAKRLRENPPPPVTVDSPELVQRVKELERVAQDEQRRRKQVEEENARLLAQAHGEAEARRKKEQEEKKAKLVEQRSRRLAQEWDETGLNPHGGLQLMEETHPLLEPLAKAMATAQRIKHGGAGGPLSEDTIYQLIGDLRSLADLLSQIMQTRKQKSDLLVDPKEG